MIQEITQSNSVIPFDEDNWKTMKMLRGSLNVMKERNSDGRFNKAIDKEATLLREYVKEYTQ